MIKQEVKIAVSADKIAFTIESDSGQRFPLLSDDYDLSKLHLQIRVSKIFQKVLNIRSTMVKSAIEIFDKDDFVILGDMLSKLLLEHKILNQFFSNTHKVVSESPGIRCRIVIEFDKNVREMAELPWEYIRYENQFLAAHARSCFDLVRKISLGADCDERRFAPPGNLNIILVIADPQTRGLALPDEEKMAMRDMMANLKKDYPGKLNIEIVGNPNRKNLFEKIKEAREKLALTNQPYILHFFGHARPDAVALPSTQDNATEPDWVTDRHFAEIFEGFYPSEKPVLMVFTACDSGKITHFDTAGGVALQMLAQQKLMAVLAMQNEILAAVAIAYMDKVYREMLLGSDLAEAVSKGRTFLGTQYIFDGKNSDKGAYSNNAFGSPVLFTTTDQDIRFLEPETSAASNWVEKICSRRQQPACQRIEKYPLSEVKCKYCNAPLIDLAGNDGSADTDRSARATTTV